MNDEAQHMFRSRFDNVADIGAKGQHLLTLSFRPIHLDGDERRIGNADAHFFHRSYEIGPAVLVLAQDRGKQPDQRLPADRRAHVEPGAIGADLHVDIAAKGWVPPVNGGQSLVVSAGLPGSACDQRCETCRVADLMYLGFRHRSVPFGPILAYYGPLASRDSASAASCQPPSGA